jgi:hypothetical protein
MKCPGVSTEDLLGIFIATTMFKVFLPLSYYEITRIPKGSGDINC